MAIRKGHGRGKGTPRIEVHLAKQPRRIREGQAGTTVQLARQARRIGQLGRTPNGSTKTPHRRKLAGVAAVESPCNQANPTSPYGSTQRTWSCCSWHAKPRSSPSLTSSAGHYGSTRKPSELSHVRQKRWFESMATTPKTHVPSAVQIRFLAPTRQSRNASLN